jgi:hypothetical protein
MNCHYGVLEEFSIACDGYVWGGHENPLSSYVYYPLSLFLVLFLVVPILGGAVLWMLLWIIRGFQTTDTDEVAKPELEHRPKE